MKPYLAGLLICFLLYTHALEQKASDLIDKAKNADDHQSAITYAKAAYETTSDLQEKSIAANIVLWRLYYAQRHSEILEFASDALRYQQDAGTYFVCALYFYQQNKMNKATHCCQRACKLVFYPKDWKHLVAFREEMKDIVHRNKGSVVYAKKMLQDISRFIKNYIHTEPPRIENRVQMGNLILDSATIRSRKSNGKKWDAGWGGISKPDVVVKIYVESFGDWKLEYETKLQKNTLQPKWEINTNVVITPAVYMKIVVFDKDLRSNDPIGEYNIVAHEIFADKEVNIAFEQVESMILQVK
jgi:tetratricopeptide (TPR) repeat protein